jgi:hypothetical protein
MKIVHNKDLHNLYPSSCIIRVIKSRRTRNIARMGELKMVTKLSSGKLNGRVHSEDLGIDRRIILEWISGEKDEKLWIRFIWLRIGTSEGLL